MLDLSEFKRRLQAAQVLRGYNRQADLGREMARHGWPVTDPERLSSGAKRLEERELAGLQRVLRMPAGWFTEPDLDRVLGVPPTASQAPEEHARAIEETAQGREQGHRRRESGPAANNNPPTAE